MQLDAIHDAANRPTGAPESGVRCARLSERPDWSGYLATVELARDYENSVREAEGVSDLYPLPARLPVIEGVE